MGLQFTVQYMIIKKIKNLPLGTKACRVEARNWLEAIHIVKMQYGSRYADHIDIEMVCTYIPALEDVQAILWTRYSRSEGSFDKSFIEAS